MTSKLVNRKSHVLKKSFARNDCDEITPPEVPPSLAAFTKLSLQLLSTSWPGFVSHALLISDCFEV